MSTQDDYNLIMLLSGASGCSLDASPKTNWVERGGGLPSYICHIAKAVMKTGKSKSSAIAIAVSRVKAWAAGGDDVDADTRAKATKALSQWEALKSKNKSKKVIKASREDGSDYIVLSNIPAFNVDFVRRAYDDQERQARRNSKEIELPYTYIRELWTTHLIVESDGDRSSGTNLSRVPYTVSNDGSITFGTPIPVAIEYVDVFDDELSTLEKSLLGDVLLATHQSPADRLLNLSFRG